MADFLLELRSEEIPARMQDKARADLEWLFVEQIAAAGLKAESIVTYATPRRLALIAKGLPTATQAVSEELKGPPAGAPAAAIDGFLRKAGLTRDALETREVKGRATLFAVIDKPGRATADVLAAAIPAIVRGFPWPKSMRWGAASLSPESPRWVRPLQGIVAILGEELVPCDIAGVTSGYATVGHRFHHPGAITIGGAHDYVEKLRACHVIVDQGERRGIIALGAKMAAQGAGLSLIEDDGLLNENAGLTEWPVPLLGRFDAEFLSVPPEVIQLTARVNQKYFVCNDADGTLANAFICVANIDAEDGGDRIVEGNRKVLAARLSDAWHFFEEDQWHHEGLGPDRKRTTRRTLDDHATKLGQIVFHEKLGTVHDKVERVAKLARWLVEEGIVQPRIPAKAGALASEANHDPTLLPSQEHMAQMAEHAARLAKADLVTGMVGEFPELQGLMGGYYAAAQGEPREVWEAVRDHYKPVGQGDEVPTAPVTVAVSLADKLDTIAAFFAIDEKPTGSKDPFALRRAAIAILAVLLTSKLRVNLIRPLTLASAQALLASRGINTRELAFGLNQIMPSADGRHEEVLNAVVAAHQDRQSDSTRFAADNAPRSALTVLDFFADRLKVQQREAGVRHDLIDAVFALGGEDDLVRLLARVHALQAFVGTSDGANLLAGYKRAANILKKEGYARTSTTVTPAAVPGATDSQTPSPEGQWTPEQVRGDDVGGESGSTQKPLSYTPETEEAALIAALDAAEPKAAAAIEAEDFEGAMAALATLRAPIDAFFDKVTVNDADAAKREARLALLARMRAAVHRVADFSKIDG
ncbi:glycine--tRNA ligase subunit beta [Sphingomonas aestuarii]